MQVQSADEIIQEVRTHVFKQKPWRGEYDESVLTRRASERQEFFDRSFHIILPDNRVRAVEDRLSRRIRAQLLGESDVGGSDASMVNGVGAAATSAWGQGHSIVASARFGESKERPKRPIRPRNPWYLPPNSWHTGAAAGDGVSGDGLGGGEFPYYAQISKPDAKPGSTAEHQLWEEAMKKALDEQRGGLDGGGDHAGNVMADLVRRGQSKR